MLHRLWYGPPNYFVIRFNAEQRRAFFFWIIVWSVVGAFFFGSVVLYVTVLAIIGLFPNYLAETPVEEEEG